MGKAPGWPLRCGAFYSAAQRSAVSLALGGQEEAGARARTGATGGGPEVASSRGSRHGPPGALGVGGESGAAGAGRAWGGLGAGLGRVWGGLGAGLGEGWRAAAGEHKRSH